MSEDAYWMGEALKLAAQAGALGEVPVGAVVVDDTGLIAAGHNETISAADPTAHAEIVALRTAAKARRNHRVVGATLYVTIEPCMMCAGALVQARIQRLVYGAAEPKAGAVQSHPLLGSAWLNHRVKNFNEELEKNYSDLEINFNQLEEKWEKYKQKIVRLLRSL